LTKDYIVCRGFCKSLIAKYLNIEPCDVHFRYGKNGKPYLDHGSKVQFNITHAGRIVALAMTACIELGVDVEYHDTSVDTIKLAKHFFAVDEYRHILSTSVEHRTQAFFECWTRKEALIKATGDGLSFPLHQFVVNFGTPNEARLLHTYWDPAEATDWQLYNISIGEDYSGAIAIKAKDMKVLRM